jgi:hypothetical protein
VVRSTCNGTHVEPLGAAGLTAVLEKFAVNVRMDVFSSDCNI